MLNNFLLPPGSICTLSVILSLGLYELSQMFHVAVAAEESWKLDYLE